MESSSAASSLGKQVRIPSRRSRTSRRRLHLLRLPNNKKRRVRAQTKYLTRAPAAAAGACCDEDDLKKKNKKNDDNHFSDQEKKLIDQAINTQYSPAFSKIRDAQQASEPAEVNINGLKVQYEPNLPAEGTTMFGENGFVLGPRAFASEAELNKTLLHEIYRLNFSEAAGGVSGQLAAAETRAAAGFAERAFGLLK